MKLNSPSRRAAIVLAGALLGLTGLTVAASPASAHDTTISGEAGCDTATGTRYVNWTVTNDWPADATVYELTTTPNAVADLQNGSVIPKSEGNGRDKVNGKRTFKQEITTAGATEAKVEFKSTWPEDNNFTDENNSATVKFTGPCAPVETPCVKPGDAKFTHTFAVKEDGSTATVTLNEGIKLCEGEPVTLVSYFAPKPQFSVPQYKFDWDTGTITNENRSVDLAVDVPKCNTQVDLFFGSDKQIFDEITEDASTRYGDAKLGSKNGSGSRSKGPQGWYNGGSKTCQTPAVEPLSQCDGTVNINLSNDGLTDKYPIDFTVKAGEFSKTVTVTKGKGETVTVPAGSGSITVSAPGMKDVVYDWTPPADCELPSVIVENDCKTVTITVENPEGVQPATARVTYGDSVKDVTVAPGKTEKVTFERGDDTYATVEFPDLDVEPIKATLGEVDCDNGGEGGGDGGDSDEPSLPVTGPVAGGIAGVAALLLIGGGVFFFLARRRKVTFTA
ncbi:cell wall anchor protein [Actinoplanes sp. NPDC049599]|uniref:cell wall anchor protein n=1 Tax=Actinoplanes sp. NPDC049599 TaxID=3363903 RepID=UPI003796E1FD